MRVLELCGVSKVYGSGHTAVKAMQGVDLKVEKGEIVLIMGPSGSGKTTLLSMAGALLRPTEGDIFINGKKITDLGERELPRIRIENIGFVFQAFNLLSNLTALENVMVPMKLVGRRDRLGLERAQNLLSDLGLKERLNHLPKDLSGGEQQRVAIARALANQPKMILADEPTGNLDSKTGRQVIDLLCRIACEQERTVVMVGHDERIKDIAHRVLWMEDGRIKETF